jgi:hypothetical protein
MKKIIYFLVTVVLGQNAHAQNKQKSFFGQLQYSAAIGFQHNDAIRGYSLLATAQYPLGKHWQLGLGSGVDKYSIQTLPVFAAINYLLDANANNTAFLFGHGGLAFNIDDIGPVRSGWNMQAIFDNAPPALYTSMGFGYRIGTKGKAAIELSAGYTYSAMQFNYLQADLPVNPYDPFYNEPTKQSYSYQWGRLFFSMGLVF